MISTKPHITERAHIKSMEQYRTMYRRSIEQPEEFWREQAGILPTVPVERTVKGVAAGRDEVLEKGVEVVGGGR